MRAAVLRPAGIEVAEVPEPEPGSGHVLVRSLACGICGSDLHAAEDMHRFAGLIAEVGAPGALDPDADCIFGHELCCEIVEHGPDTTAALPVGAVVCSVPILFGAHGPEQLGYSNRYPGGLAELMVLQEALLIPVPEGMAPELAALTEPLAVGEHAVVKAELRGGEVSLVVGCGPVGLAVIAALKERGVGPVVAADFSPGRRRLAERLGADEVLDPAALSPYSRWGDLGVPAGLLERGAAELFGGSFKDAVIFECVGSPGVLRSIIKGAPPKARIVVVGVCMATDEIEPFFAVAKELELRFAFGYTAQEYATTLARLSRTALPVEELITDVIDLDDVAGAFEALKHPGDRGKVMVRHR
ncbi:MAG: zinc-binding dehydrogenase [Acidimicrobiales bacterium]